MTRCWYKKLWCLRRTIPPHQTFLFPHIRIFSECLAGTWSARSFLRQRRAIEDLACPVRNARLATIPSALLLVFRRPQTTTQTGSSSCEDCFKTCSKLFRNGFGPLRINFGHIFKQFSQLDEPFWMIMRGWPKAKIRAEGFLANLAYIMGGYWVSWVSLQTEVSATWSNAWCSRTLVVKQV